MVRSVFFVANLWTELPAHGVYATVADGTECKNPSKTLVAATFEKAITYVFADVVIHNPKVGGSIPPPATNLSH
jgi:hypothetical protein